MMVYEMKYYGFLSLVLLLPMIMEASGNDICQTETYSQAGIDFPCSSTCSNLINGGDKDSLHNKNCKVLCPNCYEYQVSIQPTKPDPNLTTLPTSPVSVFTITPTSSVSSGINIGIPIATLIVGLIVGLIIGAIIVIIVFTVCYRKCKSKCMDRRLGLADPEKPIDKKANGIRQVNPGKGNQEQRGDGPAGEAERLIPGANQTDPGSSRERGPGTADYNPEPSSSNEQTSIKEPQVTTDPSMPDRAVRLSITQPGEDRSIQSRQERKTCTNSFMEERGIHRGQVEHPTSIRPIAEVHEDPKVVDGHSAAYSDQLLERLPQHVSDHDQQTHVKVPPGMRGGIVQETAAEADGAKSLVEEEDTSIGPRKTCTGGFIAGLGIHSSGN